MPAPILLVVAAGLDESTRQAIRLDRASRVDYMVLAERLAAQTPVHLLDYGVYGSPLGRLWRRLEGAGSLLGLPCVAASPGFERAVPALDQRAGRATASLPFAVSPFRDSGANWLTLPHHDRTLPVIAPPEPPDARLRRPWREAAEPGRSSHLPICAGGPFCRRSTGLSRRRGSAGYNIRPWTPVSSARSRPDPAPDRCWPWAGRSGTSPHCSRRWQAWMCRLWWWPTAARPP